MTTPANQKIEQWWETPSHADIVALTKSHVEAMQTSDADAVWLQAGMPHVLVETIGRRSGKHHRVALPTWTDPEGHLIIVASFAGAPKHPAWFFNIRDADANPTVQCRRQGGPFEATPEVLEGAERTRVWDLLIADRAWYADYQEKAGREIPLIRLREVG